LSGAPVVLVGDPGNICRGPRYVLARPVGSEFRLVCADCRRGRPAAGRTYLLGTPVVLVGYPGTWALPLGATPRGAGRRSLGSHPRASRENTRAGCCQSGKNRPVNDGVRCERVSVTPAALVVRRTTLASRGAEYVRLSGHFYEHFSDDFRSPGACLVGPQAQSTA
jgi:hypothetical protein